MARQKGTLSLASNIEPSMAAPLDARLVVNEVSDLTASGSFPYSYVGMPVVVKATGDLYILTASDPTNINNWKKGAGGDVPTKTSDLTNDSGFITSADLPTKVSDLTNDSGFITKVVDDLTNYYTKSSTYTKTEVDGLISAAKNGRFVFVNALPTEDIQTNVIYLVPKSTAETSNTKDEYINLDGTSQGWELIGDTTIDLSGYVTDSELETALGEYVESSDLTTTLADYVEKSSTSGLLKNDGTVDTNTYLTSASMSGYVEKSSTAGLLKNDGTVDTNTYATASSLGNYIAKSQTAGLMKNDGTVDTTQYVSDISGKQDVIQYSTMPTASASYADKVVQFTGTSDVYTNGFFYKCVEDNGTYSWEQTNVQPDSSGGDAELQSAVTSNLAVGAIASGTTLAEGTSFTEFVQKLLITEIAPTISFSISKSGNVVYGGSYTETLTVSCTNMGTAKKIKSIAWYEGSTLKQTDTVDSATTGSWTYTMSTATTDTTTFKAIITYTKSNDADESTTKTASINFYYNKFYGAVSSLTPTEATVEALSTVLGTSKGGTYSFTTSASRMCYAYPKSLGALTSIKDGNGFSLFNSFTRTEQTYTQNGTSVVYYRYVLTDASTVSGYSVIFA